jgi:hypothetical protein
MPLADVVMSDVLFWFASLMAFGFLRPWAFLQHYASRDVLKELGRECAKVFA